MNTLDQSVFNEAVRLAQNGQTTNAYNSLKRLSELYPQDSNVLLWLAFSAPDSYIARQAISTIAQIDPQNPSLPAARQWLDDNTQTSASATANHPQQPTYETSYNSSQARPTVPSISDRYTLPSIPEASILEPVVVQTPRIVAHPVSSVSNFEGDSSGRSKTRFSTKRWLIISGAIIVFILISGFQVFLAISHRMEQVKPPRLKADVARHITNSLLISDLKDSLIKDFSEDGNKVVTSDIYATPQNLNDTRKFYDTNLKKENWKLTLDDTTSLASDPELKGLNPVLLVYDKDETNSQMVIIIMGPATQKNLADFDHLLKPGESIILLVEFIKSS